MKRARGRRYFPAKPLREKLLLAYPLCRNQIESSRQTNLQDLADLAGVSKRTLERAIKREELTEQLVDAICCWVLRVHPMEIYGEEWLKGGTKG